MKKPKEQDVGLNIFPFLDDFTLQGCAHRHPQSEFLCIFEDGHIPAIHEDVYRNQWRSEDSLL